MAKRKANVAGAKRRTTDEEFVRAWVGSSTRAEVAEALGIGYNAVCVRSKKLIAAGVKLSMERACPVRGPREIDVKGLNALIAGK